MAIKLSAYVPDRKVVVSAANVLGVLWREDKRLFFSSSLILIPAIIPFVNAYIYMRK